MLVPRNMLGGMGVGGGTRRASADRVARRSVVIGGSIIARRY